MLHLHINILGDIRQRFSQLFQEQNLAPGDMVNITLQALDQSGNNTREASAMWGTKHFITFFQRLYFCHTVCGSIDILLFI